MMRNENEKKTQINICVHTHLLLSVYSKVAHVFFTHVYEHIFIFELLYIILHVHDICIYIQNTINNLCV